MMLCIKPPFVIWNCVLGLFDYLTLDNCSLLGMVPYLMNPHSILRSGWLQANVAAVQFGCSLFVMVLVLVGFQSRSCIERLPTLGARVSIPIDMDFSMATDVEPRKVSRQLRLKFTN